MQKLLFILCARKFTQPLFGVYVLVLFDVGGSLFYIYFDPHLAQGLRFSTLFVLTPHTTR